MQKAGLMIFRNILQVYVVNTHRMILNSTQLGVAMTPSFIPRALAERCPLELGRGSDTDHRVRVEERLALCSVCYGDFPDPEELGSKGETALIALLCSHSCSPCELGVRLTPR